METIYMKYQSLFSGKIKKNISKCRLLKFYPEFSSAGVIIFGSWSG